MFDVSVASLSGHLVIEQGRFIIRASCYQTRSLHYQGILLSNKVASLSGHLVIKQGRGRCHGRGRGRGRGSGLRVIVVIALVLVVVVAVV